MPDFIEAEATCIVKIKAVLHGKEEEWSEEAEFVMPKFSKLCVWKKCPDYVNEKMNMKVATKVVMAIAQS